MTGRDLDEIMLIELESFTLPWSRQSYENELSNRYATYMVADHEGVVAAYGGMWVVADEAHITNVAVAPRYRRQGMGTKVLQALLNTAGQKRVSRIFLEVRVSNDAAFKLYSGQGFAPTGVRKQYYSDNDEDAIVMMRQLQSP
ncbi:MAG TPA: ribosomal-protein-alanine N-acetyltransferase [Syntrophomonas sp.]|nr:ribosomal-protein-alanine N-acetyltransferase [Syntrophomonas sp.]